jgi:hypothetical protein
MRLEFSRQILEEYSVKQSNACGGAVVETLRYKPEG